MKPTALAERIEIWPIDKLAPYARNARTHSEAQIDKIAASILEFGFNNPILVDGNSGIIAGHGRHDAAKKIGMGEVPVIELTHLSDTQKRAYILADNRIAMDAGWNDELLASELADLEQEGFDLSLTGFNDEELSGLLVFDEEEDSDGGPGIPETPIHAVTRPGDVWILGKHRLMCGDSTNQDDVEKLMNGKKAALLHADPPYGMGKESEGIINDNLYDDKLISFQMDWWKTYRPHLTSNASAYIWGNSMELWSLWFSGGLGTIEPLRLRNEIVWDKKNIAGMASPDLTQYPTTTERCLFFQLGSNVFYSHTKDNYWPGWDPIRLFMVAERDKAGFTNADVNKLCGSSMAGHWFSTSQWTMMSKENYQLLRDASGGKAFTHDYQAIHDEYKQLLAIFKGQVMDPVRKDFEAGRPFFDNAHDIMRDVWEYPRVVGEERFGHATPKPVSMMERIMKSSLRQGDLCDEPFGGTGSTLIGAEKTGRICYVMELQDKYCDVIVRRWQQLTGKKAVLDGDGSTFEDMRAIRT
jgi:DNA modification methylase